MADENIPDLSNRDPTDINRGVKVMFEDVLAEPEGAHSAECVWNLSYKCYTGGRNCCYMFLTYLCGLPMALCWGCGFACLSFKYIWCWTPGLRCCEIIFGCQQRMHQIYVNCCCAPICETMALCFSKIKVTQG